MKTLDEIIEEYDKDNPRGYAEGFTCRDIERLIRSAFTEILPDTSNAEGDVKYTIDLITHNLSKFLQEGGD